MCAFWMIAVVGSPPRVRGKGIVCLLNIAPLGITPARAGKRRNVAPFGIEFEDHPRACGEKFESVLAIFTK